MRRLWIASLVLAACAAGPVWAGVVPNGGGQSMSGAKIKPPAKQEPEKGEPSAEKEDGAASDKP